MQVYRLTDYITFCRFFTLFDDLISLIMYCKECLHHLSLRWSICIKDFLKMKSKLHCY